MAAAAILNFSKIRNFNGLSGVGGPICVIMPNLIKIGKTVTDIYGELTVFIMAAVRHLGFVKFEIFNGRSG